MSREEYAIWLYLNERPDTAFPRREIARRATKRAVFEKDPHWADESLAALVARGVVESNDDGLYQLKRRVVE